MARNAEKRIDEKGVESPGEYVRNFKEGTPLGQKGKNLGDDIGSSVEEVRKA
ncbi:hypothetical protein ANSO36C_42480 [Nostoc cf. commune SO-36]|uniref:Uncharacterized protein n=1 Tax=Nostoc cf. commune SO-36 TaxID=449208 RepID=A0ABN6Q890_NOSCO|nr:hypothetical protein [Nostoc commune]BDI18446.1 hypothetical protein ANSO36C_42480 [Nostoc cf. commune SO-36]